MKACMGSKILHSKKQEVCASTKVMTAVVQSPLIYLGDFRIVMQINTSKSSCFCHLQLSVKHMHISSLQSYHVC